MAAATTTTIALLLLLLSPSTHGSTLKLISVNSLSSPLRSTSSLSWLDNIIQMQNNDKFRLQYLTSLVAGRYDVPITVPDNTYIAEVYIGKPPQKLLLAFDTSQDATWVACRSCIGCPNAAFNTRRSSTLKRTSCNATQCSRVGGHYSKRRNCWFTRQLGDSKVESELMQDNIGLATDTITGYTFGGALDVSGKPFPMQGLLGLGRGPLSLLSQADKHYKYTFLYSLPSFRSLKSVGSLRLGQNNQPKIDNTTPLLTNPKRPSLYIVKLVAVAVGTHKTYYIPRTYRDTVIDTGTMFTTLAMQTYRAVRDEVRGVMWNERKVLSFRVQGFDTCYNETVYKYVPHITLMFTGGMNVTLPQENVYLNNTKGPTTCLAMAEAPKGSVNTNLNVLASFQQQNLRVLINANSVGSNANSVGIMAP